ncbi:hypothetical protein O6H91_19G027100 [Diphasiastrum complanatum]|uniref:Uncharacterized protein n=1 Tax=Diphasiastrum complanatum TaxID=34168 RepID=A0ACC2ATW1_DIPCM|nr:hypothetical protein O6H91_19G027100 [Diphasiastrum complanatum]
MKASNLGFGCRLAKFSVTFLILVLLNLAVTTEAKARIRRYKWKVDYSYFSPDCVEKVIIAINGQYPGPRIRAQAGDTIVVELENGLPTEGVVIHWHGIHQFGTPWYDGTAFVSQCPINPGETFTYKFVVPRPGTYFYHGHFGMQRAAGFYGSLIVDLEHGEKEPFAYDGELSIILNDWWHRSIYDQETGLFAIPFRFVGEPQSLLIEGRGRYNCSLVPSGSVAGSGDCVSCNSSNPQCQPYILPVEPGKTYRLRIASVASLSSLNFILEGHNMTIVEADGYNVDPVVVENLDVYSGETYSVLFTANQNASRNYWAAINVRGRKPATPTGLALLNYLPNPSSLLPSTPSPMSPVWNDFDYSLNQNKLIIARKGYEVPPPPKPDRQLIFLTTQNKVNGRIKWAINNITYVITSTPVLAALKYGLKKAYDPIPPPDYPALPFSISGPPANPNATVGSGVYTFQFGSVVDVIIQNANTLTPNNSEVHPWHLHGHDFWVLGYGKGIFDPATDPQSYNLKNAPLKNTVAVLPYGWVAIRFRADNPGVWPFHCHIEAHFHMGMGLIFAEGWDRLPELPKSVLGCGLSKYL